MLRGLGYILDLDEAVELQSITGGSDKNSKQRQKQTRIFGTTNADTQYAAKREHDYTMVRFHSFNMNYQLSTCIQAFAQEVDNHCLLWGSVVLILLWTRLAHY